MRIIPEPASDVVSKIIRDYTVAAGETITAGDLCDFINGEVEKVRAEDIIGTPSALNASNSRFQSAVALTDSKVFIAYQDFGNSEYNTAVVVTIDGGAIDSVGTPVALNANYTWSQSAVALTDSKVLVAYQDSNTYNAAVVVTIDGTSIDSVGTPVALNASTSDYQSAVRLTDSKVLIAYGEVDDSTFEMYTTAVVVTIDGTTIDTVGTPVALNSSYSDYQSAVALTDSKVLIAYRDFGNFYYNTAVVATIDGTIIDTVGTPVALNESSSDQQSAVALTDSKVLIAYRDIGNSSYNTAVVVTIDGTTIDTVGTPVALNSSYSDYQSVVVLTDLKVLIAYRDFGNSEYNTTVVATIDGTTIIGGTPVALNTSNSSYQSAVLLTNSKVLIAYRDDGNSSYNTASVYRLKSETIPDTPLIAINSAGRTQILREGDVAEIPTLTLTPGELNAIDSRLLAVSPTKYLRIGSDV